MYNSEQELAKACARGDGEASRQLYVIYSPKMYSLCSGDAEEKDLARDLMHDAFIKAYDKIGRFSFRGEGSLGAWMSSLTIRLCIDNLRKRKKMKFIDMDDGVEPVGELESEEVTGIAPEKVRELLMQLPPSQRTVFNLYFIDKLPHKEIARLLGIKEKTSTSILSKARLRMEVIVKQYLSNNE